MKFLHTMVRVTDIDQSLHFYCDLLGLKETRRNVYEEDKFTLVFLAAPGQSDGEIELTFNHGSDEVYKGGRNFGHLAFEVDNVYETCQRLMDDGVTINRPPREGRMAFVLSPDGVSVELLQKGSNLPVSEPWASMPNSGTW